MKRTPRRLFLRGLGGLSFGLPWLERFERSVNAQTGTGPRRVITVTYSMGVPQGAWRPNQDSSLPYVSEPLSGFLDRTLFVSSLDHSMLESGGDAFVWGHPAKHEAALTGTLTTGAFPSANSNHVSEVRSDASTEGGANDASVEHVIGEAIRSGQPLRSIDLGVDGAAMAAWGGQTSVQASQFCFEGRGNAISLNLHPHVAFNGLFAGLDQAPSADQEALLRLRARNQSVLDAVRESFNELKQGLGRDDQRRLEEHAERIRQLEIDVQLGASCAVPSAPPNVESYQGLNMAQIAPLQIRILARAMGCDLAPVGRLDFVNQQSPRFGIAELDATLDAHTDGYDWHAMVHGDPLPGTTTYLRPGAGDGEAADYDTRLLAGYRFFVEQFAALLTELDAIPEGPETSVLDNSLVILASDLGEGLGHGHFKMGYVLSGNLGGARPGHFDAGPAQDFEVGGQYYYSAARYNVNQLLNSMLDMAGVADVQGQRPMFGLQGYLEAAGLPRRIDELFEG